MAPQMELVSFPVTADQRRQRFNNRGEGPSRKRPEEETSESGEQLDPFTTMMIFLT